MVIAYLEPLASGKGMNCGGDIVLICLVVCLMARANCRASGCCFCCFCCVGGHSFASGLCKIHTSSVFHALSYGHCNQ